MSWLQVDVSAAPGNLDIIEAQLEAAGALSLTLLSAADSNADSNAQSTAGEPVLEPAPGETPLWQNITVRALFELDVDVGDLRHKLSAAGAPAIERVAFVGESDWAAAARSHAVDRTFGARLRLRPKPDGERPPGAPGEPVQLYLEPGLAFGSGSHPTTSMCLEYLAAHVHAGMQVLDFGCGSGVLGIAAALLGGVVVAVDHDPQAIVATRENAAYNGLSAEQLEALDLDGWQARQADSAFDIVAANILAEPLKELAPALQHAAKPGAAIVLSGVLEEQAEEVMNAYQHVSFAPLHVEAGWALLTGVKA